MAEKRTVTVDLARVSEVLSGARVQLDNLLDLISGGKPPRFDPAATNTSCNTGCSCALADEITLEGR